MDSDDDPQRLKDLAARLDIARGDVDGGGEGARGGGPVRPSGLGIAWRVSVELVSAVLVGTWLGWLLDGWLGTRPWLMVVFLLFGGAAGVMNVYRVVKGYDDSVGLGQAARRAGARGSSTPKT
ncbi:MAG: AtpZ/AtpI family protein [Alphaproteobacteria bacterium]